MDDTTILDPPSGIDVATSLTATTDDSGQALDSTIQLLPFPFCLSYQGSSWQQTTPVYAPSPEAAALTMTQYVQLLNAMAVKAGYPAGYVATAGACS
jgi:hypothetical protein